MQLMQVYVQKSTSTTLPSSCIPASVNGSEFTHPPVCRSSGASSYMAVSTVGSGSGTGVGVSGMLVAVAGGEVGAGATVGAAWTASGGPVAAASVGAAASSSLEEQPTAINAKAASKSPTIVMCCRGILDRWNISTSCNLFNCRRDRIAATAVSGYAMVRCVSFPKRFSLTCPVSVPVVDWPVL